MHGRAQLYGEQVWHSPGACALGVPTNHSIDNLFKHHLGDACSDGYACKARDRRDVAEKSADLVLAPAVSAISSAVNVGRALSHGRVDQAVAEAAMAPVHAVGSVVKAVASILPW